MGSAVAQVAGELDLATAPRLGRTLRDATEHAALTLLPMHDVSFMDCSGLRAVLEASANARRVGRRLLVLGLRPEVENIFTLTGTRSGLDALAGPPAPGGQAGAGRTPATLANPVNAKLVTARVMAVPDRDLWLHADDGAVRRAWAPAAKGAPVVTGRRVEVYLDARGAVNGWWDAASGLAVNQRHLEETRRPVTGDAMACQGSCAVVWQAPAAARLAEHDERCLTCAGALAPG